MTTTPKKRTHKCRTASRSGKSSDAATSLRTLVLVDFDNLRGGSVAGHLKSPFDLAEALGQAVGLHRFDHVIVGSGPTSLFAAGRAFPAARLVLGRGVDGADHALLGASSDVELIARCYERTVVVSGDGIFADRVAQLASAGQEVGVVGREGTVSRRLQLAADWVHLLPTDHRVISQARTAS